MTYNQPGSVKWQHSVTCWQCTAFVCYAWHPACPPCVWVLWPCSRLRAQGHLFKSRHSCLSKMPEGRVERRDGERPSEAAAQRQAWIKAEYGQTPPCLTIRCYKEIDIHIVQAQRHRRGDTQRGCLGEVLRWPVDKAILALVTLSSQRDLLGQ